MPTKRGRPAGKGAEGGRAAKAHTPWWIGIRNEAVNRGEGDLRTQLEDDLRRVAGQIHPELQWAPCMAWVVQLETLQRYVAAADRFIAARRNRRPPGTARAPVQAADVIEID